MTRKSRWLDFNQIFSKSHADTGARVTSALKIAQDIQLGLVIKISNQIEMVYFQIKNFSFEALGTVILRRKIYRQSKKRVKESVQFDLVD